MNYLEYPELGWICICYTLKVFSGFIDLFWAFGDVILCLPNKTFINYYGYKTFYLLGGSQNIFWGYGFLFYLFGDGTSSGKRPSKFFRNLMIF
jgi:hypothetical protein